MKFGTPTEITSDNGTQFISEAVQKLMKILHTTNIRTTTYHSEGNGQVERFNDTLCTMLSKLVNENKDDWDELLPFATWAYNTTWHRTIKTTPYRMVFNRDPTLTLDKAFEGLSQVNGHYSYSLRDNFSAIKNLIKSHIELEQEKMKTRYDSKRRPIEFRVGEKVLLVNNKNIVGESKKLRIHKIGSAV